MSAYPYLLICSLFFGFFLFASPVQSAEAQISPISATQQETVSTINAQDFRALITDKKPLFILDVRQQDEYDAGHIENSVLIPLDTLKDHYKELPKDKKSSSIAVAVVEAQMRSLFCIRKDMTMPSAFQAGTGNGINKKSAPFLSRNGFF